MERNSDLIIIPDVHGRGFWKDCVAGLDVEHVVFLGDYLDPYPEFGLTPARTIENFKEIIDYKKSRIDSVTLLLGNHDFGRYIYRQMSGCRTDNKNLPEISKLFADNRDLFKVGYYETIGDTVYTFTHAAFIRGWAEALARQLGDVANPTAVIDKLNSMYASSSSALPCMLDYCSRYRGGWGWFGSPVWGDVCEMDDDVPEWPNTFEVFAHTRLSSPALCKTFLCCDCGTGFRMTPDGTFTDMHGVPLTKHLA